jgi:glycosyltransferase involved in cell wall biosynthesis
VLPAVRRPVTRILILAPTPFFGDRGCHVRIYEEVRGLAARGVDTLIVTYPTGRDLPDVTTARSPAIPGIRARALGPSWSRPFLDLLLLWTTLRAVRRYRPDVIHAHLHEGILLGRVARRLSGVPLVADIQGSLTAELRDHHFPGGSGWLGRVLERIERWLVRGPEALLASGAATLPLLVAQGARVDRVVLLPDGVDLARFHPQPPDRDLQARFGLTGKDVVVFLGVLTAYQGVDTIVDALPLVIEAVPTAHFLILGYPNEDHYRQIVRDRGLESHATLPGRVDYHDAARYLSLGTVAVSPKRSLTEANGKLINYMACGLPVIATDTPVNRDLLGEDGVYVPIDDAGALADAIVGLLRDPAHRQALGARVRSRAERLYAWPPLIDRLCRVYDQVTSPPG